MPFVRVETNVRMDEAGQDALAGRVSALAAKLTGKPERWVMACVRCGAALVYGGSREPAAFVEFKSIGLDATGCAELSAGVCGLLEESGIPADRVYIEFRDLPREMFGWNRSTF